MSLERIVCKDREEWLIRRSEIGIGASEVAAICGENPWVTPYQLWKTKIGAEQPKDLSDNAAVQQGIRMEPALREFFKALHPEYEVEYHAFDILRQKERPHYFATLDGELIDENGRRGILEIKTANISSKTSLNAWRDGKMPQHYFIQNLAQLLATGYEYVCLFAALYFLDGDISLKQYEIQRIDVEDDLADLLKKEDEFYKHIEDGTLPSFPLPHL